MNASQQRHETPIETLCSTVFVFLTVFHTYYIARYALLRVILSEDWELSYEIKNYLTQILYKMRSLLNFDT
jgi:hypothetical protein